MFSLFIQVAIALIAILVILFIIWLIAFMIHIARDEISMDDKQKYSSKPIDVIVNKISAIGLRLIANLYQFFHRG